MNSVREQIIQAIVARVEPVAVIHGATVVRQPLYLLDREDAPVLIIEVVSDRAESNRNDRVERALDWQLIAHWREGEFSAADKVIVDVHKSLMTDRTFGGLAQGLRERSCEWLREDVDAGGVEIPVGYTTFYRTRENDISVKG